MLSTTVSAIATLAFAFLLLSTSVQAHDGPAASTFFLPHSATQFSVNIANDSSDVYLFLSAPADAWVGFGFGAKMERSLMLIAYPDETGANVTVSPRMGRAGGEPVATRTVKVEVLPGSGVDRGVMSVNARCKDCRVWPNGFLDATSTAQDVIFAFGPADRLQSSALDAPLKRHVRYGHFTMDLTAATGVGGVPLRSSEERGVQMGGMTRDADRKALAHALLGCVVLFVVWPINVLIAGFIRRTRFHMASLLVVVVCLGVVYGLGISNSYQYNRTKAFATPHQLLALISLLPLAVLTATHALPSWTRHLQAPLSSVVLCLLLITGGLGLHLAQQTRTLVLVYIALSLLLVLFLGITGVLVRRRARSTQPSLLGTSIGSVAELGLLSKESRAGSEAGSATSLKAFLDESRRRDATCAGPVEGNRGVVNGTLVGAAAGEDGMPKTRLFGGGTMPGPQYLLNMHPGVPVQIGSGRRI